MRLFREGEAKEIQGDGYLKRIVLPSGVLPNDMFIQEVLFQAGQRVPMHHHAVQTEVFIPLSEGVFVVNGETVRIGPGDLLVCEPGDVHGNPVIEKDFRIMVLKLHHHTKDIFWDE
jgi:quercetin dioxygenase-like cupin family protein